MLSVQVINGYDQNNIAVDGQHYSSATTDGSGSVELEFTLLVPNTSYIIFVSAEGVVPYTPRLQLPDAQVQRKEVQTGVNMNLMDSRETIIESLEKFPELAEAVAIHINSIDNKKQVATASVGGNMWKGSKKKRRHIKK